MLLSFIYIAFVSLLKLLIRSGRPAHVKERLRKFISRLEAGKSRSSIV